MGVLIDKANEFEAAMAGHLAAARADLEAQYAEDKTKAEARYEAGKKLIEALEKKLSGEEPKADENVNAGA